MPFRFHTLLAATALLITSSALSASAQGYHIQGYRIGNVIVPSSSIERPEDVGRRAHTNHLILASPAGGQGPGGGLTPAQLQSAYKLPATGGSQIIAIVDAYDNPNALTDFNTFSAQFGLPQESSTNALSSSNQHFQVIYDTGSKPTQNNSWGMEEALDFEWAHALAPSAKIVLVEAQSNSMNDLMHAVDTATGEVDSNGLTTRVVSMSWGGSEFSGETSYDSHFNSSTILYFASAGDSGGRTIYPSVSPYVVSAGGTTVNTDSNGNFVSETAWSGGGGGPSSQEGIPTYQSSISTIVGSSRGTPDLSFDANPNTGVSIYDASNGGWFVVGGTSVSSPSLAGIEDLALAQSGASGQGSQALLSTIYSNLGTSNFRDITSGNNGYAAGTGWDYCTGVGSLQGLGGLQPSTGTNLSINGLSPSQVTVGNPSFTLTVNGTGFVSGSTVNWSGAALNTTFVSANQLTATVPAADIASPGTASITVVNPDGLTSNAVSFTIANPAPVLSSISPGSTNAGGPAFTLIVKGQNLLSSSVANWNGSALTTTYVSATELKAAVPASLIASAGKASVTVTTPAPGGGTSKAKTLTILETTLKLTGAQLSLDASGNYVATLTLKNSGYLAASSVTIKSSSLNAVNTNTSLPVSMGSIAAGSTSTVTLTYPASAGTAGSAVMLKVSGTFTGGTFSGSVKVTLP